MKIIAFTMITNPDYRQDPWKESIRQMLELADEVIVVCGDRDDVMKVQMEFPEKVSAYFMHWPQPEWGYDELPAHLNLGLDACKSRMADWALKFDIDYFIHEKDVQSIRRQLFQAKDQGFMLASFEKLQFHLAGRAYEKGKMPIVINLKTAGHICYGRDNTRYTDLCQPIEPDGRTVQYNVNGKPVATGEPIPDQKIFKIAGARVWNYDYTFKTEDRARELLYYFDRSHAKFWSRGYNAQKLEEITADGALANFLALTHGRLTRASKVFKPEDHPKHIQTLIKNITPEHFGHSLWGRLKT